MFKFYTHKDEKIENLRKQIKRLENVISAEREIRYKTDNEIAGAINKKVAEETAKLEVKYAHDMHVSLEKRYDDLAEFQKTQMKNLMDLVKEVLKAKSGVSVVSPVVACNK